MRYEFTKRPTDKSTRTGTESASLAHEATLPLSMLIAVALCYLLSAGPVCRLALQRTIPDALVVIYVPLERVCQATALGSLFWNWYLVRVWHCDFD